MHQIKIRELTQENFNPYGLLVEVPVSTGPTIETDQIKFWKQQAVFSMGDNIEVGVLKVKKHEMLFNKLENHFKTPTILLSLDGDFILPVATPKDDIPSVEEISAFKIPKFQMIVLAEKCWHGDTYPIDKDEITLFVIFAKDSLELDTVFEEIEQECRIS